MPVERSTSMCSSEDLHPLFWNGLQPNFTTNPLLLAIAAATNLPSSAKMDMSPRSIRAMGIVTTPDRLGRKLENVRTGGRAYGPHRSRHSCVPGRNDPYINSSAGILMSAARTGTGKGGKVKRGGRIANLNSISIPQSSLSDAAVILETAAVSTPHTPAETAVAVVDEVRSCGNLEPEVAELTLFMNLWKPQ